MAALTRLGAADAARLANEASASRTAVKRLLDTSLVPAGIVLESRGVYLATPRAYILYAMIKDVISALERRVSEYPRALRRVSEELASRGFSVSVFVPKAGIIHDIIATRNDRIFIIDILLSSDPLSLWRLQSLMLRPGDVRADYREGETHFVISDFRPARYTLGDLHFITLEEFEKLVELL